MPGLKARVLGSWIGDRVLRDAVVVGILDLGPVFRRITLRAPKDDPGLRSAAGDKVQMFLPEIGARTYTPFANDTERGTFDLLAYVHGQGPGASWARSLTAGQTVRMIPPRDSIPLASLAAPVAIFGDETSFAVARALLDLRPSASVLLEVASLREAEPARSNLSLSADMLVERGADEAFFSACAARIESSLPAGGTLVLTGNARSIQSLRARLRGGSTRYVQKVKPYWAPGKSGLD